MKKRLLLVAGLLIVVLAVAYFALRRQPSEVNTQSTDHAGMKQPERVEANSRPRVPTYYEIAPSSLPPTLAAESFTGKPRDAYRVAKEIPETLAQLPCYCHCDMSIGHKSLHSCFVDQHAASCAVCVNEALTAYRLQKEQRLSAAQIREKIIAEFSKSD
jgi:uncharacterized protein with PCYCGC motif